jgi:hypothetical protein
MNARLISRIESGMALLASASLAGAVAFAACSVLKTAVAPPQLAILSAAQAVVSFMLSGAAIRRAGQAKYSFRGSTFGLPELGQFESDELLLCDEDRLPAEELVLTDADRIEPAPEPLVLDDVLAEIGPDSRVVRLFDRKAMPTPGQLQSRIEDHLGQRTGPAPDASQALSDALAELRRSLR